MEHTYCAALHSSAGAGAGAGMQEAAGGASSAGAVAGEASGEKGKSIEDASAGGNSRGTGSSCRSSNKQEGEGERPCAQAPTLVLCADSQGRPVKYWVPSAASDPEDEMPEGMHIRFSKTYLVTAADGHLPRSPLPPAPASASESQEGAGVSASAAAGESGPATTTAAVAAPMVSPSLVFKEDTQGQLVDALPQGYEPLNLTVVSPAASPEEAMGRQLERWVVCSGFLFVHGMQGR